VKLASAVMAEPSANKAGLLKAAAKKVDRHNTAAIVKKVELDDKFMDQYGRSKKGEKARGSADPLPYAREFHGSVAAVLGNTPVPIDNPFAGMTADGVPLRAMPKKKPLPDIPLADDVPLPADESMIDIQNAQGQQGRVSAPAMVNVIGRIAAKLADIDAYGRPWHGHDWTSQPHIYPNAIWEIGGTGIPPIEMFENFSRKGPSSGSTRPPSHCRQARRQPLPPTLTLPPLTRTMPRMLIRSPR
jgi:hypothetical protein